MRRKREVIDRLGHALKYAERNELSTGAVYIVQCNEYVKVGFAFDVPGRLCNLQIGNPYPLRLLKVIHSMTPLDLEQDIHARIEQYRVRGEWFKLPPDVLESLIN